MEAEKSLGKQNTPLVSKKFNMKALRLSLKFRPKIYRLILRMRMCIRQKNGVIRKLKDRITQLDSNPIAQTEKDVLPNNHVTKELQHSSTQTNIVENPAVEVTESIKTTNETNKETLSVKETGNTEKKSVEQSIEKENNSIWGESGEGDAKSIAEQVKEVAQSALQQNGMVYVESAGMYYDYKSGYYYNSELGLYYHNDTGCYYYYSEEQKNFVFHSYPDRSILAANASLLAHEKRKARKQKKGKEEKKAKKRKITHETDKKTSENNEKTCDDEDKPSNGEEKPMEVDEASQELEDGECSDTDSEPEQVKEDSDSSTSTLSDDDAISKHHPPCMRVIVRETNLPKLKVGSLYLVTKDGGTLGREGDHHSVIIRDTNVSRNHLDIKYDLSRRMYVATDLGSKNGTILNGRRMSESQAVSAAMEVMHGSVIQVGETKLLCHIHAGTDTCGHCEPGLVMETEEKEKKSAYNRTCSVTKQHQLELARLKNKYAPQPLMIEEKAYNDRAEARRKEVGSSHSSEKTQSADLETEISSENKGFKLLEKMGWARGEGLGKDSQGNPEPIPMVSNEGKAGLGTTGAVGPPVMNPPPKLRNKLGPATLRLASKTKMLQPPAKAFQEEDDDEEEQK